MEYSHSESASHATMLITPFFHFTPGRGICLALAIACSGAAWAGDVRSLTVGIPEGLPGYTALPDGGMHMTDAYKQAITTCVERRLHAQFKWQTLPTNRVLRSLATNEVDLIYPMGFTEERAAALLESRATWENPDVWLSWGPVSPSNKDVHIASRMGSPQHTEYASQGYAHLTPTYSYDDLPRLLAKHSVDVVIVPRSVYREKKSSWPEGIQVTIGKQRNSGFYLNKADPKGLLNVLNAGIERCIATIPNK